VNAKLVITSLGEAANTCLKHHQKGVVHSVFARCAYLEFKGSLLCLAHAALGNGPVTLLFHSTVEVLSDALRPGATVHVNWDDQSLSINDIAVAQFAQANEWSHTLQTLTLHAPTYRAHQRCLARMPKPAGGFIALVLSTVLSQSDGAHQGIDSGKQSVKSMDQAIARFARPSVHNLLDWLRSEVVLGTNSPPPPTNICALIGAGSGLTPSGDDLLAGVLLTLQLGGYSRSSQRLWELLQSSVSVRTNRISAELLQQAAAGRAGEHALSVLALYTAPGRLAAEELSAQLAQMGSTSGWDFLAGVVLALDAVVSTAQPAGFVDG